MSTKDKTNSKNYNSFKGHFYELRKRIVYILIIYLISTIIGFILHREILEVIVKPVEQINELTQGLPVFTNITEFWGVVMKVSLLTGLLISFPFIFDFKLIKPSASAFDKLLFESFLFCFRDGFRLFLLSCF